MKKITITRQDIFSKVIRTKPSRKKHEHHFWYSLAKGVYEIKNYKAEKANNFPKFQLKWLFDDLSHTPFNNVYKHILKKGDIPSYIMMLIILIGILSFLVIFIFIHPAIPYLYTWLVIALFSSLGACFIASI